MFLILICPWICGLNLSQVAKRDFFISDSTNGHDIQYIPRNMHTFFCFAVLCCGYTLTDFPISIRLTSLALWQFNDCPSASKATLMNMDKYFIWIHYERLHNHNKAKHNKTVCIFLGIYCTPDVSVCPSTWYTTRFCGILLAVWDKCSLIIENKIEILKSQKHLKKIFNFLINIGHADRIAPFSNISDNTLSLDELFWLINILHSGTRTHNVTPTLPHLMMSSWWADNNTEKLPSVEFHERFKWRLYSCAIRLK